MINDTHLHIGLNNWTEEALIRYLDEHNINKGWVLTWDELNPTAPGYYQALDIDMVRRAYKNYPDRIVPFYAPDPGRKDWKQRLSDCLDEGFKGCGELKVAYRWNDPRMIPLLEFLDQHKLPLVFHMERARNIFIPKKDRGVDWLFKRLINERFNGRSARIIHRLPAVTGLLKTYLEKRERSFPGYLLDIEELSAAAKRYAQIRFIAHGPHIWNHFSLQRETDLFLQKGKYRGKGELWKLLKDHPNIYCDLSGLSGFTALTRNRNASKEFLDQFHKKLLFGTDNMDLGLLDFIQNIGIEEDKLQNILFHNSEEILRN